MHYCWGQKAAKKECEHLGQSTSSKISSATWQWLVWTTGERCTLLLLNFLNLRDLFGVWRKLKESIFKNSNQINSTVTPRTCFDVVCCSSECMVLYRIIYLFYFIFTLFTVDLKLPIYTKKSLYSLYGNNIELTDVSSVTEQEMQSFPKKFLKSMWTSWQTHTHICSHIHQRNTQENASIPV